jgi:protein-tyrosine phosphatase
VLVGAFNFRDLGGHATADGRRIRSGRVFRSNSLQELTADDVKVVLEKLELRTVIDLRGPEEIAGAGIGPLEGQGLRYENLPLLDERVATAGDVADLGQRYRTYLHSYGVKSLVQALTVIADGDAHPLVFHCSAGKDRTGVLAAMVLGCLGVPADEVVADYCAMQEERRRLADFLRRRPGYADLADHDPILDSRPETMREFLRVLDEEYGGPGRWALASGLAESDLEGLQAALLEPDTSNEGGRHHGDGRH